MPVDLTRFDLNVHQLLGSEDVQMMDCCEFGQYMLLLCHAWQMGKDTTLPNDPKFLAKITRVDKVSDIVLKKFQVNDAGRLFNQRLLTEWELAIERSSRFSESGKKGATTKAATMKYQVLPKPGQTEDSSLALARLKPGSLQAKSIQVIPIQPKPSQVVRLSDFFPRWRKLVVRISKREKSVGPIGTSEGEFQDLLNEYSSEVVLDATREWAEASKDFIKDTKYRVVPVFLKQAPKWIEGILDAKNDKAEIDSGTDEEGKKDEPKWIKADW